ncbi:MAG: hypothetical protein MI757_12485 [Pirellulales bacterium]|nr:hypothetical protein [Pirellulales bacterium]
MSQFRVTTLGWFALVSVALVVTINQPRSAFADDVVVVSTKSGRTFRGAVDAKSNNTRLWLRSGATQIQILRPIEWTQVESVIHNGTQLSGAAFHKIAASVKTSAPKMPWPRAERGAGKSDAERAQEALKELPPRVVAIDISAFPANWDRDVEVDGLVVTVTPLDGFGEMLPTSGTLEVELVTEMSRAGETITAGESRIRNQRIGRWTRRVEPEHFGVMGASYRLPFKAIHPEFEHNLINLGLVNARLSVPGTGTFNASATDVRVRPLSTYRDRLENRHGGRFEPIERTGQGKIE